MKLENGDDIVSVRVLCDSGSDSSFFHPALLSFATHQRKIDFKLETLSCKAKKPEIVKGIEASFEVEIPGGSTVQLNLLQHEGLKTRNIPIKAKLLTCPQNFADKHGLEKYGLTEACPEGQHR